METPKAVSCQTVCCLSVGQPAKGGWKSLSNDFLSLYKGVRGGGDEHLPNKAARLIWLQLENDRFHETVHTRIIRRNQASRPASNNVNNWKSNQNRLLQFDGADWSVRYRLQSLQTACLPSSSLPPAPCPQITTHPPPSLRFSALNRYQREPGTHLLGCKQPGLYFPTHSLHRY